MTDCSNLLAAFPGIADSNCGNVANGGTITITGGNIVAISIDGFGFNGNFPSLTLTHITTLTMKDFGFTGSLPDLSGWTQLATVDLSNNLFTGTVNSWYTTTSTLTNVNLQYNCLSGASVPSISGGGTGTYDNNLFTGGTNNPACSATSTTSSTSTSSTSSTSSSSTTSSSTTSSSTTSSSTTSSSTTSTSETTTSTTTESTTTSSTTTQLDSISTFVPSVSSSSVISQDSTSTVVPAESTSTFSPQDSTSTVPPETYSSTFTPGDSTSTVSPTDSTPTEEPTPTESSTATSTPFTPTSTGLGSTTDDGFFFDTEMSTDFGSEMPTDMQTDSGLFTEGTDLPTDFGTDFGTDISTVQEQSTSLSVEPGQNTEPVWTDWWVEPSPGPTQSSNVPAAPQNADCLAVTRSFARYTTDPSLMIDCGQIANTSVWQWEYAPSAFVKRAATSSKNFKAVGLKLNDIPMNCGTKCLIPPAIGNLGSLKNLSFSGSGFTGPLPTTFAKLKNLVSLDLSGNKLTTIPNIFSGMKNLANVDLTGNSAIKTLPPSLVNAPKIASLVAVGVPVKLPATLLKTLLTNGGAQAVAAATAPTVYNQDCLLLKTAFANYTYTTPAGVKGKVKTLLNQDCFTLTNNTYVAWTIPPSQNTSSTTISASVAVASAVPASSAATSTAVTSSTGKLVRRSHHLERRAPSNPQTSYRLSVLKLANLQITGNLPDALGKLPYLSVVDVSGNKFSGTFPSSFLNLTLLSKLNIAGNSFLGVLPNGLTALIATNGGSLSLGTVCVAGNPAAVCPIPKQITGPVDCFALSRDATFVNPIYDPLWKRLQDFQTFNLNLPKSSNPTVSEYMYWQFYHYIKSVQLCQKSAPYYSYFTYAKVNQGSVPVYPSLANGMKRRRIR